MNLIEVLDLGTDSFWFHFQSKTSEQYWEKFHAHQGLEFLYIHQGNARVVIDQEIHLLKPKTLICLQPFQLHKINITADEESPYVRTMLVFNPTVTEPFIQPFPTLYTLFKRLWKGNLSQNIFELEDDSRLLYLFSMFNQNLTKASTFQRREELTIFLVLFLSLIKGMIPYIDGTKTHTSNRNIKHVEKILEWTDNHYQEEFSLEHLASDLHLSPYYVSHLFRKDMGYSITEYLMVKRIQEACLLLSTTNLPIQTIGKKIGLKSDSYFSQLFKKNTGMTPNQYRKSQRNFFYPNERNENVE